MGCTDSYSIQGAQPVLALDDSDRKERPLQLLRRPVQKAITGEAEVGASRKVFDLQLDRLGPYSLAFTRSGRHMLLGGRKGHLALMDWQRAQLLSENQVAPVPAAAPTAATQAVHTRGQP